MRTVQEIQLTLGRTAIEDIDLDVRSRDDIPAILLGIQFIYRTEQLRDRVFGLLESRILGLGESSGNGGNGENGSDPSAGECGRINPAVGRPGMQLWNILVLGLLKQGLNCDYDRVTELANKHADVRRFLGLNATLDEQVFSYRTVNRNLKLLTPDLLAEINQLVVREGHALAGYKEGDPLKARCDSFVVETNVHYPTDVSLLRDALRCLIRSIAPLCKGRGIAGWRQSTQLLKTLKQKFNRVRQAKKRKGNPERVRSYLEAALEIAQRAEGALAALAQAGEDEGTLRAARSYLGYVQLLADQVERRVLRGEKIPHEEKVFSIFEEHTRWCVKGKAGVPVELGVPVCIVESEHRFVMNHEVMWKGSDVDVAVGIVEGAQGLYAGLSSCSFDKGFHSPANRTRLAELLSCNAMPRKGRLSKAAKEMEGAPEFVAARQAHPAVESAINNLECRGLDRVMDRGAEGFERMIGLAILAANVHRVGRIVRDRERDRERERLKTGPLPLAA